MFISNFYTAAVILLMKTQKISGYILKNAKKQQNLCNKYQKM